MTDYNKDAIKLFNKMVFLKKIEIKWFQDLHTSVKDLEKSTSKLFNEMIEKRRMLSNVEVKNLIELTHLLC